MTSAPPQCPENDGSVTIRTVKKHIIPLFINMLILKKSGELHHPVQPIRQLLVMRRHQQRQALLPGKT